MQGGLYIQRTVTSTQYNPTQQTDVARSNAIGGLLAVILLDVGFDGGVVGHYTQMIWRDTTEVGCAIASD